MSLPIGHQSRTRCKTTGLPQDHGLDQFAVLLPEGLARFGGSVRASLCGPSEAPVVIVLGGISANHLPFVTPEGSNGWWAGMAGADRAIDPALFRILGIDFAADPAGKLAPSTQDQAAVIAAVLDALNVARAHAIVGASYGGMAALAFGQDFASRVGRLVVISAPAEPHPNATAVRELQRRVVELGIANGNVAEALGIARGLAMLTYRTPAEFEQRFSGGIRGEDARTVSEPGAYLRARGEAFAQLMSAERFLSLSAAIDRHHVDPEKIEISALLIGSSTDQLVPPSQMEDLAGRYGGPAKLHMMGSLHGHDMFLKDVDQVSKLIGPFLRSNP